jgi:exonuclease III
MIVLHFHNNMKILFWNINGPSLDQRKALLSAAIEVSQAEIVCIAEGTPTIEECVEVVRLFEEKGYMCYYSPLFYRKEEWQELELKWYPLGLKIFVKGEEYLDEPFSYARLKRKGRMISVKLNINKISSTVIFLHNYSKKGTRDVNSKQVKFIGELESWLTKGPASVGSSQTLMLGDFNLEPWDNILRDEEYLMTSFLGRHDAMANRVRDKQAPFFNPLGHRIFELESGNLGGTYYDREHGWALFDFVLYQTRDTNLKFEILTNFGSKIELLEANEEAQNNFLKNDLDHLPILIEI